MPGGYGTCGSCKHAATKCLLPKRPSKKCCTRKPTKSKHDTTECRQCTTKTCGRTTKKLVPKKPTHQCACYDTSSSSESSRDFSSSSFENTSESSSSSSDNSSDDSDGYDSYSTSSTYCDCSEDSYSSNDSKCSTNHIESETSCGC